MILAALCGTAGCATIMASGPDKVSVVTNPPGAHVFVNQSEAGQTPVVIDLDRAQEDVEIRLELPGFTPMAFVRSRHVNGWVYANFLIGGLLGIIVDVWAKNAKRFDDDPIAVGLTPEAPGSARLPAPSVPEPVARPVPDEP